MESSAQSSPEETARRVRGGEERALARLISGLEDGDARSAAVLRALRAESGRIGQIIGLTGPPGAGKSTLADKLIGIYRGRGERVGVLAVDPSSPFTGGAILGDRIRMQAHACDPGVFIRSLASRGRLGGLSRATAQAARALEAAGYGLVLVETVGIGQSEVDIARLADSVVLISMPSSGDDIQTIKAGVMEIGDIFVVNKADRDGADRAVREIEAMLEISAQARSQDRGGASLDHGAFEAMRRAQAREVGRAPVLKTVAETGEGLPQLAAALDARWEALRSSGGLEERRRRGAIAEARALLSDRVLAELELLESGLEDALADRIVRGELEAAQAADILFKSMRGGGKDG